MIISLFIFWRLGLTLTSFVGSMLFSRLANGGIGAYGINQNFDYWSSWAQWDGGHFFYIAKSGYTNISDAVFMPLYPLATRAFNFLIGNLLFSGLLVSNIALILFLYVFFKTLKTKYNLQIAKDTLITFLVFPTAFFCIVYYSESLFLLFTIICFWFVAKKKFLFAALFAAFSAVTRLIGIFLVVSVIYAYISNSKLKISKKIIDILILVSVCTLPLIAYIYFLNIHFKNPLLLITSQGFWGREIQDPVSTIFSYFWSPFAGQLRPPNDYFDLAATLFFLGVLVLGRRKIPSSVWIFSSLAILIPASTGTLTSMPRYILGSIGAFIIFAKLIGGHTNIKIAFWLISLVAQIILVTLFINGYWIA